MSIDLTLPAHRLLALLTSRQISAREVVDATLARIETINPRLNAIIAVDAKGAIDAAERIDAARRKGEDMAPLAGLPVTIKDAFDVAGFATVAGVEALKENRPATDAVSVARLRARSSSARPMYHPCRGIFRPVIPSSAPPAIRGNGPTRPAARQGALRQPLPRG
ncbi:MAG: hypothetical protein A4S15_02885 [Candidatus Raskinella chloraquaticus]|uniref:Amidase domain-containing protein n=1 Tax=Candidatus Raskinella chloraquaticus TaxID=1951219 RepID=A0A1W9HQD3_9HYPH|nr:MAG: hypothetical protein A4S15_02885 [Proteobacteria bacterium SG_bin8]